MDFALLSDTTEPATDAPTHLCNFQGQVCFRDFFFNFEKASCPACDRYPLCDTISYEYSQTKETIEDREDWCSESLVILAEVVK